MQKRWWCLPFLALLLLACSLTQVTQPAPVIGEPQISESEVPRVTVEQAYDAWGAGALFVDVRAASSYEASHITGAISIPLDELETRLTELDPGDWIITYCT